MRQLVLAALVIFSGTAAAHAQLRVCNESGVVRSVAIGYSESGNWTSEGWWILQLGECKTVRADPLRQRYIYWRATTPGREFEHENFMFCISDTPFTIVGDTDCAARGFSTAGFRKLDTGPTATEYTLTLPVMDPATAPDDHDLPAHAAILTGPFPPGGDAFERGQLGEPFTQSALMQECTTGPEAACFLYADGFRYAAFASAAHAPGILDLLGQLAVNTPVYIRGDILSYGDITAEVILSQIAPGPADPHADLRAAIQGPWVSNDDALYTARITGSEMTELYDNQISSVEMLVLDTRCPDGARTDGLAIGLYEMGGDPMDARCWAIDRVTQDSLEVFNLPRGNILSFRRP